MYVWFKALHVAAVLLFTGGLMTLLIFVQTAARGHPSENGRLARAVHGWNSAVTTPALVAVWAFGLAAAVDGEWLSFGWLQAKLALVLLLSGLHGILSGALRRSLAAPPQAPRVRPEIVLIVPASLVAIAILAVVKP